MTKHYSEPFKQQAIHQVLSQPEHCMLSTAKLLGIGYCTLDKWMQAQRQSMGIAASAALRVDQQSILALKRENAHLPEVNDILKKAHVYFVSNPSLPGTRS